MKFQTMNSPHYSSQPSEPAEQTEMYATRDCQPTVTVVVPVYNGGSFVRATIESLLTQSYSGLKILVICDGSPDPNDHHLGSLYSGQIDFVSHTNRGRANTLNRAIFELVTTPLIARCDQDDLSHPNRIATQVAAINETKADVCLSRVGKFVRPGRILATHPESGDRIFNYQPNLHGCIVHSTLLAKTEFLRKVGGYNPELEPVDDYDLNLRMHNAGKVVVLNEILVDYRVHDSSDSFKSYWEMQDKTRYLSWKQADSSRTIPYKEWRSIENRSRLTAVANRCQEVGRLFYRRAGIRLGSGRLLTGGSFLLLAGLLAPAFALQRLRVALTARSDRSSAKADS